MAELDLGRARFNMIEQQVRTWDVLDQRVLDVYEQVPREAFVDPAHRHLAYADINLPLAHGEVMLSPKQEGRILQALALTPDSRVLEVGTGSGYLTACLATLAGPITSVDIHEDLLVVAQERLEAAQLDDRISLLCGDAASGWEGDEQFDAIAVTGSLPELHEGFHRALRTGGRLFVVVGDGPIMEGLLITRVSDDQWSTESLLDTFLPPLHNAPVTRRFAL